MLNLIKSDLFELYNQHFDIVRVTSPALLDKAYQLRYQVYCDEHEFEDPSAHLDRRERDEYDSHSVHSLLVHRATASTCGTVRLILADSGLPFAGLPIYGAGAETRQAIAHLPVGKTAEISRFAVSKAFRRRVNEALYPDMESDAPVPREIQERRVLPYISFGLIRAVVHMSVECGIDYLCAVMEPALIRNMARFGINFELAGPLVDYHGKRQPCFASLANLLDGINRSCADLGAVISMETGLDTGLERGRIRAPAFAE